MPAYLFTWNPPIYPALYEDYQNWLAGKFVEINWSSGNNKSIRFGARFFLMRQGVGPKGIIGSGYTLSVRKDLLGDDGTPIEGKNANDISFDVMTHPDKPLLLAPQLLKYEPNPYRLWSSRRSGVSIQDHVAEPLELAWKKAVAAKRVTSSKINLDGYDDGPTDPEGRPQYVRHLIRERSPRLVAAKKADAIRRFGVLRCEGCDKVASEVYGPVAADVIECHHVKWLSHTGETVTTLDDLALLCPNCHTVTHKASLRSVGQLRKLIQRAGLS